MASQLTERRVHTATAETRRIRNDWQYKIGRGLTHHTGTVRPTENSEQTYSDEHCGHKPLRSNERLL